MNNQNISETLNFILTLQKNAMCNDNCIDESCTRPFLGPINNQVCFNTRPINLLACCGGNTLWEMPYELNGTTGVSNVFRVENVECGCATFRVLVANTVGDTTTYTLTNSYFTIDLSCVLALRCLNDTYVI